MKAAVYLGKEKIEIKELPMPKCGDNDVVIENLYSSICGTDVAVFHHGPGTGHRVDIGGEFGHETVSRIAAVGKNITGVHDRRESISLSPLCQRRHAPCRNHWRFFGIYPDSERKAQSFSVWGRRCHFGPARLPNRAFYCRLSGCKKIRARKRRKLPLCLGCGTIGMAAAVTLKHFGMEKVLICDFSRFRLNIAKELGFTVCNIGEDDVIGCAKEYFGTAPSLKGETADIDIWIDAAGAESVFNSFMERGKMISRFISVAVNKAICRLDMLHLTYSQKSVIGSGGYMPEDVSAVTDIMKSGKWELEKLITHEFKIEELETAIRTAGNVENALNVTIRFDSAK